jgi:hypothetical protein
MSVVIDVPAYSGNTSTVSADLFYDECTNGSVQRTDGRSISLLTGSPNIVRAFTWGGGVFVYVNGQAILGQSTNLSTGNPGVATYGSGGGSFTSIAIGHRDTVSPLAIPTEPLASSVLPYSASLAWPATVDDPNGIGLLDYGLLGPNAATTTTDFTDGTVQPGNTYTYQVDALDQHLNQTGMLTFNVTTPPAQDVDPRRIGVQKNGSYWGGGGEQIDTLSGNLNFSVPTITLQQRTGQKIPLNLSYNSQNWRQDSGFNWQLGNDTGYGFGWSLQFGSLTPYIGANYLVDHYVFTDGTGAQYRLDVKSNNVWSSKQSIYVRYDANANRLHFTDGSFWLMGCSSGGTEPDFGTMHPTVLEDVSGNQIQIQYEVGATLPSGDYNTSSRIREITDFTAADNTPYFFTYNTDSPVPHLTSITTPSGIPGNYTMHYSSSPLSPPFGSDPRYAGATTTLLTSTTGPMQNPYVFTYDTASAGELQQARFPHGGCLGWSYVSFQYAGTRTMREVGSRSLAAGSACSTTWNYTISRNDSSNPNPAVHANMTLVDASGVGAKTWNFITTNTSGHQAWQVGLLSSFVQSASSSGAVMQSDTFTWSQDPASNAYISQKVTVMDPTSSNPQTAQTNQTLDQYGNVTQSIVYGYNNTTTPIQTYNNTYLPTQSNGSTYVSNYVVNGLTSSVLTLPGNVTKRLATNQYDGPAYYSQQYPASGASFLFDPNPPVSESYRGLLWTSTTLPGSVSKYYWDTGNIRSVSGSDGSSAGFSADAATNYSAPMSITTDTYNASITYNVWNAATQTTGANNEQVSTSYNSGTGWPSTSTSAFGGITNYSYSTLGAAPPLWQQVNGPNGITVTTLDGLGRTIRVQRQDGYGNIQSNTDTVYAPCACSPLGKIQKVSQPYRAEYDSGLDCLHIRRPRPNGQRTGTGRRQHYDIRISRQPVDGYRPGGQMEDIHKRRSRQPHHGPGAGPGQSAQRNTHHFLHIRLDEPRFMRGHGSRRDVDNDIHVHLERCHLQLGIYRRDRHPPDPHVRV